MAIKKTSPTIVISVPFVSEVQRLHENIHGLWVGTTSFFRSLASSETPVNNLVSIVGSSFAALRSPNRLRNIRDLLPMAIIVVVIIGTIFGAKTIIDKTTSSKSKTDSRVVLGAARGKAVLGNQFLFPVLDSSGKEITQVKYVIGSAELQDEIIVQGQRYVAVKGRTFFILNLKLINSSDKTITLNSRDYIRLTMNKNDQEKIAADIHNDPVEVQPISTKETRLGWPVDDTAKNFVLLVGQIDKDKTPVPVQF